MTKAKKKRAAPRLKVGDTWYLRLPQGSALTKAQIIDCSRKVVEIVPDKGYTSSLYAIEDLEFVEKVCS